MSLIKFVATNGGIKSWPVKESVDEVKALLEEAYSDNYGHILVTDDTGNDMIVGHNIIDIVTKS